MGGSGRLFAPEPCAMRAQPYGRNYSRPHSIRAGLEHASRILPTDVKRGTARRSGSYRSRRNFVLQFVARIGVQGGSSRDGTRFSERPGLTLESFYRLLQRIWSRSKTSSLYGETALRYSLRHATVLAAVFLVTEALGLRK